MKSTITEPKKNILIADNVTANRELLCEILGDGYNYYFAENGEAALTILSKKRDIDILLLNIDMPKFSGMNVLKVMRDKKISDEIPVVVISSESDPTLVQNACYLGAVDYIIPPFNPFLIRHRVETALAMYVRKKYLSRVIENQVDLTFSERDKKEFFSEKLHGIIFEYNAISKELLYIRYYNAKGEQIPIQDDANNLLGASDLEALKENLPKCTREKPTFEMTVLIPINAELKPHLLSVKTLWSEQGDKYTAIVGFFTDATKKKVNSHFELLVDGNLVTTENLVALRGVFDFVRLLNPKTCRTLTIDENGAVIEIPTKCCNADNRKSCCKNCSSQAILDKSGWMSKPETHEGSVYSVFSRNCKYNGLDCVLEVGFCIDNSHEDKKSDIRFFPDSSLLENYYLDPLTKTYSRTYMEAFSSDLENSKAVAIADINSFKKVNDTYGHIAGDATLKHITSVLQSCIESDCKLIRYGGDEFLFVFDNISEEAFNAKLAEIKETVKKASFTEYPQIKPTISIGGAYGVTPLEKAIDIADKAMYKDKFKDK